MDIIRFTNLLEILKGIGAEECGLIPENGMTRVVGIEEKGKRVGVCSLVDDVGVPADMGVLSIKSVLSRLRLFDLEKASVDFDVMDDYVASFSLKQGRRKSNITTTSSEELAVPEGFPEVGTLTSFTFSSDFIDHLNQAIRSISSVPGKDDAMVQIKSGDGGNYELKVFCDTDDFVEPIEGEAPTYGFETTLRAAQLITTLKESAQWSTNKTAEMSIDSMGNAHVTISDLIAVVIAETSSTEEE